MFTSISFWLAKCVRFLTIFALGNSHPLIQAGYLSKAELAPNNLRVPNTVDRERAGFNHDKVLEDVGGPGQVSQHWPSLPSPMRWGPKPAFSLLTLQVSRQCQLLTSADPMVRLIAEENLKSEMASKRKKFCPSNGGSRSNEG